VCECVWYVVGGKTGKNAKQASQPVCGPVLSFFLFSFMHAQDAMQGNFGFFLGYLGLGLRVDDYVTYMPTMYCVCVCVCVHGLRRRGVNRLCQGRMEG
jgi:hypothetical protein